MKTKKRNNYEDGVFSARRLRQYFQLPDKKYREISTYIYFFLLYFKVVIYLFHCFSRNA